MSEENHDASSQSTFRDSIVTVDEQGKRIWLFPKKPKGRFYNRRKIVGWTLLAILFGVPLIKINGSPLFLFHVIKREFILFGVHFWPQDSYLFAIAMISLLVGIVLFTTVYGRFWCGWTCPQTVFLEVLFRPIEYLIDGDRNAQMKLKAAAWNFDKIWKRLLKNSIFILLSVLIANALLAWVIGVDELLQIISEPISKHSGGFIAIVALSGFLFFIYSWFREQVCSIICPYGRLQGVLLDRSSIVVSYDYLRGEPRGKAKQREQGDCIDCNSCVDVCPAGIDIRNGTQLECINCTACIDACDAVMDKVKKPRGLIRYASEKNIAEGLPFKISPRIIAYTGLLIGLLIFLSVLLFGRSDVETTILRTSGLLYQDQPNNEISNLYNAKLINKSTSPIKVELRPLNKGARIQMVKGEINIPKSSIYQDVFFVYIDRDSLNEHTNEIKIGVYANEKRMETVDISFIGDKP
ncbi:MAG: cytochrome c oxidase accessory protein CcoG [Bacteroidales bacterium]|nr:cytochrome c oxidase accessory protein CcoG [Bacteroidales bacterium]